VLFEISMSFTYFKQCLIS